MYNILFLFFLFLSRIISSQAAEKDQLSAVIGCDGTPGQLQHYFQEIMGKSSCEEHHNWVHIDLRPKHLATCPHELYIQADAKTWHPEEGKKLSHVFMELFPSRYYRTTEDITLISNISMAKDISTIKAIEAELRKRQVPEEEISTCTAAIIEKGLKKLGPPPKLDMTLMPDTIINIAQYMDKGALLEIEHIPYATICSYHLSPQIIKQMQHKNPFHFYISPLFINLLEVCLNDNLDDQDSVKLHLAKPLEKQKISQEQKTDLIQNIYDSYDLCKAATLSILNLFKELGYDEAWLKQCLNEEISKYSDNLPTHDGEFKNTLAMVIAVEMYMLDNQLHIDSGIVKFLRQNGFNGISIDKLAVNHHNNRKNSWMITAVKE